MEEKNSRSFKLLSFQEAQERKRSKANASSLHDHSCLENKDEFATLCKSNSLEELERLYALNLSLLNGCSPLSTPDL